MAEVWGTGKPLRELLYVGDAGYTMIFLLKYYSNESPINIGTGVEISIADLALAICRVVGFWGEIRFDSNIPDGSSRKKFGYFVRPPVGLESSCTVNRGIVSALSVVQSTLPEGVLMGSDHDPV
jgi:GDP-L-fucose synthase